VRVRLLIDGKPYQDAWDEYLAYVFNYVDANKDGALSKEEAARVPLPPQGGSGRVAASPDAAAAVRVQTVSGGPPFKLLDGDGDGKVSRAELAAYYRANGSAPLAFGAVANPSNLRIFVSGSTPGAGVSADAMNLAIFGLLDADRDGKLAAAELAAAEKLLAKLDQDEDELLAPDEVTKSRSGTGYGPGGAADVTVEVDANASATHRLFVLLEPGELPRPLVRQLQKKYLRKLSNDDDLKLSARDLGLTDEGLKRLDEDGDGKLNTQELARFADRPADVEIVVRLGKKEKDQAAVEVVSKDQPGENGLTGRKTSGGAAFTAGNAQVELRLAGGAQGNVQIAGFNNRAFLKTRFKDSDGDNNGYLDKNEVKVRPDFGAAFDAMDADGDGMLFEKEVLAYYDKVQDLNGRATNACTSLSVSEGGRGLFDLVDANQDQKLSVRELRAAAKLLEKLDGDKDAKLSEREVPRKYFVDVNRGPTNARSIGPQVFAVRAMGQVGTPAKKASDEKPAWFFKMDRNRDGDVSKKEFLGAPAEFQRFDADGDGLISKDEAKQADAQIRKN
jgi:Ca2+-binding EF-hand superfamily protein